MNFEFGKVRKIDDPSGMRCWRDFVFPILIIFSRRVAKVTHYELGMLVKSHALVKQVKFGNLLD